MKLESHALRSRIARRIFGLFVLSALVPVLLVAGLSFFRVTGTLVEQTQTQLRALSKNNGMAVFDKLLSLESEAVELANASLNGRLSEHLKVRAQRQFEALMVIDSAGAALPILRDIQDWETVIASLQAPLTSQLKVVSPPILSASTPPQIILSVAVEGDRLQPDLVGSGPLTVLAELKHSYLWPKKDLLPAMTDLCVIANNSQVLFCSSRVLMGGMEKALRKKPPDVLANRYWTHRGMTYLTNHWNLFLDAQFGHPDWTFVVVQPRSVAFEPVDVYRWMFPAVFLLTLLLVVFLSLGQIRKSLVPLQKLKEGTEAIASGQFTETVSVASQDEFGDLARAFNTMANRLGKMFHALETLSQIDRLILTKPNLEKVVKTVLQHFGEIVSYDAVSIVIAGQDAMAPAQVYTVNRVINSEPRHEHLSLTVHESQTLLANPLPQEVTTTSNTSGYLRPLAKLGAQFAYVLPIVNRERLAGMVMLGYQNRPNLTQEDISHTRDMTDRVAVAIAANERERILYLQAHYDALTNLPNRPLLMERLRQEIAHVRRQNDLLALLFVDLDRFKQVNDAMGHGAGDQLLIQAAERLKHAVREMDTVARLGGDEFTVILSSLLQPCDAGRIAEEIIKILSQPFVVYGQEHYIGASIGIAVYPSDGDDPAALLRNADTAMYRAKQLGRGRCLFFQKEMNVHVMERAALERDIRRALDRNEFILYYQPQLDLALGAITSAEVLIRWQHPERGLVPPDKFIALAEDTGLIEPLGEWVIRAACRQYRQWQAEGIDLQRLAVNVSSRQFKQQDFVATVRTILTEEKISPQRLELEITESLFADNIGNIELIFKDLQDMGIRLAIDDFGTGYSSLSYLKRFPVNTVKIDRAFMRDVPEDQDAARLVQSIIVMAHNLNNDVVAEGIETKDQLTFLQRNHCEQGQGYYLSRPLPASEFVSYLSQFKVDIL